MELKEAQQIHSSLVRKRNELFAHREEQIDPVESVMERLKQLDREIGRYAQAYNPRISAKALAFFA